MSEPATPVKALLCQLRSRRPPSLQTLLGLIGDHENYAEFVRLVREYLPEREAEILREAGVEHQVARFAGYFEDRYFPLPWTFKEGQIEEYYELVHALPLIALGFGYQEYDDLIQDGSAAYQLMTYCFQQPYGEQGARVALGEACRQAVPAELLRRLPQDGYTPEELHRLLDDTPYQMLADWGDMINLSTGNDLLDMDEEMCGNSVLPEWERENVAYFTRQWQQAERQQQAVQEFAERFQDNAESFLEEILDFIEKRKEAMNGGNTEQRTDILPVGASRGFGNTSG